MLRALNKAREQAGRLLTPPLGWLGVRHRHQPASRRIGAHSPQTAGNRGGPMGIGGGEQGSASAMGARSGSGTKGPASPTPGRTHSQPARADGGHRFCLPVALSRPTHPIPSQSHALALDRGSCAILPPAVYSPHRPDRRPITNRRLTVFRPARQPSLAGRAPHTIRLSRQTRRPAAPALLPPCSAVRCSAVQCCAVHTPLCCSPGR